MLLMKPVWPGVTLVGNRTGGSSGLGDPLVRDLSKAVSGEVDASVRRRAEYSTDASNYRVVPQVVVFPRDVDDVLAVAETARIHGTPLTPRGGGTSVAGNSIGPGIVMDLSRHMNRVLDVDPEARVARVEPGAMLGTLQRESGLHGLRFGPDPSTWSRCTIGGMIGNNACGSHSLAFGRTADNIVEIDVVDGSGRRFTAGRGLESVAGLARFTSSHMDLLRTDFGRFGRQISGYSLEHLLPERGSNLAAALVGTEGTCVVVLEASVRLVTQPATPVLVVLGYPSMADAADRVPDLLKHRPAAIEGLDARLVETVQLRGAVKPVEFPRGSGWLLVEVGGSSEAESLSAARRIVKSADALDFRIITSAVEARAIWRVREDGAGLAGRTSGGDEAWPGFEDAAVPPENLGKYLRDFEELLGSYGVEGVPYGHFGDGCLHVRLSIPMHDRASVLRSLMEDAAKLIASHGGSLSGEHGDGRARSELLPYMYSPDALGAFAEFKRLFDPKNLLNPGVVVNPAALDDDLRRSAALPLMSGTGFAFSSDGGDITRAIHRCVGVGKCRADNTDAGGFMCPSFLATSDEKDSTRGRARVLQEMINGSLVKSGWASPEVHEALDLCLSCKACSSDCPAGVDMATFKSETLHRTYARRLRPRSHYVLGWLPRWARLIRPWASIINRVLSIRRLEQLILWAGGMDTRRSIPPFATSTFNSRAGSRSKPIAPRRERQVLLWADSFSDSFTPDVARSASSVLESAGYEIVSPAGSACCGLTWITTGQLDGARRMLSRLVDDFYPFVADDVPIVGLEPSCIAVLRSDLVELLPGDSRAELVSRNVFTLSELLTKSGPLGPSDDWSPPRLDGQEIVVQPHCHQHAVMGFTADSNLLTSLGAQLTVLSGCCGMAGNFGMERGHYEVSTSVAEHSLLPALRTAGPDAVLLADGFSCRTQAEQLGGRKGVHLAELLAKQL